MNFTPKTQSPFAKERIYNRERVFLCVGFLGLAVLRTFLKGMAGERKKLSSLCLFGLFGSGECW